MTVLSLFDGISCARVALERLGFTDLLYFASEVDKYAIQIALKNYPDTIQLGSVTDIDLSVLPEQIDLLIGGSPCQDLSIAKAGRKGLDGERSGLFWEYVRIMKAVKPRYFVLENVNSMPKEAKRIITETMGVEPIMINAALVSAQNRKRLFWTNICSDELGNQSMPLPEDRGILLKDILESGDGIVDKSYPINATYGKSGTSPAGVQYSMDKGQRTLVAEPIRIGELKNGSQGDRIYSQDGKSVTLSANGGSQGTKTGLYAVTSIKSIFEHSGLEEFGINAQDQFTIIQRARGFNKGGIKATDGKTPTLSSSKWQDNNHLTDGYTIRKLTPVECERLQSLPDNYTEGISNTQRYKCLGNGFNVEVVRHILSFIEL